MVFNNSLILFWQSLGQAKKKKKGEKKWRVGERAKRAGQSGNAGSKYTVRYIVSTYSLQKTDHKRKRTAKSKTEY